MGLIELQVSHHPMIVACHCEGRGWKFWGDSNLKSKFWGRSIQVDPVGILTLKFDDGETFQWSKVPVLLSPFFPAGFESFHCLFQIYQLMLDAQIIVLKNSCSLCLLHTISLLHMWVNTSGQQWRTTNLLWPPCRVMNYSHPDCVLDGLSTLTMICNFLRTWSGGELNMSFLLLRWRLQHQFTIWSWGSCTWIIMAQCEFRATVSFHVSSSSKSNQSLTVTLIR